MLYAWLRDIFAAPDGSESPERLDTDEDFRDREKMLKEIERSFYEHEGRRLWGPM